MLLSPYVTIYCQPPEIRQSVLVNVLLGMGPYYRMQLQANAAPQADPDETEADDE